MSEAIKLTLSDEQAARLDAARGLHSRQEYIINALVEKLEQSGTLDRLIAALASKIPEPAPTMPRLTTPAEELHW